MTATSDAVHTADALRAEAEHRDLALPTSLHSPGPQWAAGYRSVAMKTNLPGELHDLDAALKVVGACLTPLLADQLDGGSWDVEQQRWRS